MSTKAQLIDEVERLTTIVDGVASAFEPEMDAQLAGDERAAVQACREAAEAASQQLRSPGAARGET